MNTIPLFISTPNWVENAACRAWHWTRFLLGLALAALLLPLHAAPPAHAGQGVSIRTIYLSPEDHRALLDPSTGHIFISDPTEGQVEMRAQDGTLLRTIAVGKRHALSPSVWPLLAPWSHRLFVGDADSGTVSVLDTRTGVLLRTIQLGLYPAPLTWDTSANRVFFDFGDPNAHTQQPGAVTHGVAVLDGTTGALLAHIPLPGNPEELQVDETRHRMVFSYQNGQSGSGPGMSYGIIDTLHARFLPTGVSTQGLLPLILDTQRGRQLILNDAGAVATVVDYTTGAVLHVIPIDAYPEDGVIDPRTGLAYIVSLRQGGNGTWSVLDLQAGTVVQREQVGEQPVIVSLDAVGDRAFVAFGAGQMDVFDTTTYRWLSTITVGHLLQFMPGVNSHDHTFFVCDGTVTEAMGTISPAGVVRMIDPRTGALLRSVDVGENPGPLLENTASGRLYITSVGPGGLGAPPLDKGTLSVINAATGALLQHVSLGFGPQIVDFDFARHLMLALNTRGDETAPLGAHGSAGKPPLRVCTAKDVTFYPGQPAPKCQPPDPSLSIIALGGG